MGETNFDTVRANQFLGGNYATQGKIYYVNPRVGVDSNSGKSPTIENTGRSRNDGPLLTILAAYNKCVTGQNDIVVLQAAGNSITDTAAKLALKLTWSKNNTHLVGWGADSAVSQRSRIINDPAIADPTTITSLMEVSGNGCKFKNIQFFHGDYAESTATGPAIIVSGERNVFEDCHIAGMGHADLVGAGGASLKLNGGNENVFRRCVIGLDTISAANLSKGEIWFDGSAHRNLFEDCLIQRYISNAGYVHITVEDSAGIDRWTIFKNCIFSTDSVNRTIGQVAVMSIPAMSQGKIILFNSTYVGDNEATCVWEANARGVVFNNTGAATAAGAGGAMLLIN